MGVPDGSLLDLLVKVKSWISWVASDLSPSRIFPEFEIMSGSSVKMCCNCHAKSSQFLNGYHCQSCGKWLCAKCLKANESLTAAFESNVAKNNVVIEESLKACMLCNRVNVKRDGGKNGEKVHPVESPRDSPEPPSPSVSSDLIHSDSLAHYLESRDYGYSPQAVNKSMTLVSAQPSSVSVCSTSRSDEDEAEDSGKHFDSPSSGFYHDLSDIDSNSVSTRLDFYCCKSVGSSPLDSPSRISFTSYRNGHLVQRGQGGSPLSRNATPFDPDTMAVLGRPGKGIQDSENTDDYADDLSTLQNHQGKSQKPLEFEKNGLVWLPPPPEDENDEAESNFFAYDDDEDDIGDSGAMFSSSSSLSGTFPSKNRQEEGSREPLRAVIQGHFRALVSQLLQGGNIRLNKEDGSEVWLDVVTNVAWQAANFVKPDTSKGGSMDPVDYVKVKCMASGRPCDSTLVKGVVCTKNIKHKRMTTQYKNPRLLLLGGALECQSVVNPLASFQTLVQQENDHLKMIISKIEALRPNVLLVERSVSPYAQEYLLAKDISLVLNVKKPLLERIARCTGALISPSIDNISTTRSGHCELFRVERVSEEHEAAYQFNKKPSKTLMFFEGCPRRLGCTVILKGSSREELKKVKHVVQYAIFAAYHLSLETSFLADEGASLPKMSLKHSIAIPERMALENAISVVPSTDSQAVADNCAQEDGSADPRPEHSGSELLSVLLDNGGISALSAGSLDYMLESTMFDAYQDNSANNMQLDTSQYKDLKMSTLLHSGVGSVSEPNLQHVLFQEKTQLGEARELAKAERIDENEVSSEYFSATDTYQSILVSFSSRCVLKGPVCERSRLLRIKFYGSFDKPLGRYLRDDLFDQTSHCRSCNEPAEAHVLCYTHQQGNLTINVRSLSSVKLPGERDGKIWMWHRCLRCAHIDGVPPATHRVVMSDAAWGLSFGKFLELSFSNHATANRVAPCGHSLQRDCLRFYGFGSMVAFFRYSPIDILNVHLPPSRLEFNGFIQQDWIRKEAAELLGKMEAFYEEISDVLDQMEQKSKSSGSEFSDTNEFLNHIMELKDQLYKERNDYNGMLQPAVMESSQPGQIALDILELNQLKRALVICSHAWDRQLYSLDSLLKTNSVVNAAQLDVSHVLLKEFTAIKDSTFNQGHEEKASSHGLKSELSKTSASSHLVREGMLLSGHHNREDEVPSEGESSVSRTLVEDFTGDVSNLSERIDSVWTGTYQLASNSQPLHVSLVVGSRNGSVNLGDNPLLRRLMGPVRVHSFDSALRIRKGLHLSTLRSFHASGDFRTMVRDPVSSTLKTYSQMLPLEAQRMNLISSTPSFISSASHIAGGARLLLPQRSQSDIVVGVYDDDPASIVSYALSSKEYEDWIENDGSWAMNEQHKVDSGATPFSAWQSFGSLDMDFIRYGGYVSEDATSSIDTLPIDSKRSPHITISYGDDSPVAGGKVRFSVTCYFGKQFDSLRKRCCPSEVDFVRSLSRCQRWSAQGGKSNVYFAKSLDERFIIKQVKKTELESFEEFAPEYFKYLMDFLKSGSPTCLAKVLGIYQVTVKHLKGGKEVKMDLMVMENLFYQRNITRVYDLKGSARSRYNPETSGRNKVLLDMNLVEALRTEPIFLGSKAKRSLERAIWNDTSFLASVDVMDYSLLVGIDEEQKELVLGIIDFMRQYTWDKHLETWVKASGILGGPKSASPTIISPKQYKKRFRKAMTSYFLTIPDQWSS